MTSKLYADARTKVLRMYFHGPSDVGRVIKSPFNFKGLSWDERKALVQEISTAKLHYQVCATTMRKRLEFEILQHNQRVLEPRLRMDVADAKQCTVENLILMLDVIRKKRIRALNSHKYH